MLVTAWRRENEFQSTGRKSFRCTVERAQHLKLISKCYSSAVKRRTQPNQDNRPVAILASDGRLGPIHVVDRVLDSNEEGTVVVRIDGNCTTPTAFMQAVVRHIRLDPNGIFVGIWKKSMNCFCNSSASTNSARSSLFRTRTCSAGGFWTRFVARLKWR